MEMEKSVEDVVIVGAGIAGLATALGLHRLGIRSLVLESGDSLRTSGFALEYGRMVGGHLMLLALETSFVQSTNGLQGGIITTSVISGLTTSQLPFTAIHSWGDLEFRFVNRKVLLETLETELPKGTIRFSSKVVRIETDHHHHFNSIHLADGTVLQSKVLIGCDGVNSVVARFLGFSKPSFAGRSTVRGLVDFENGHGFEPKLTQFVGKGMRYGVIPCDDRTMYWFFTFSPTPQDRKVEEDPIKLKQFILSKLGKVSDNIRAVFEKTQVQNMQCDGVVMNFVRDKIVAKFMAGTLLKKAGFDCGKLTVSS
ncbi:Monooxygenase 3 [Sesamum angolense]|uniref:Monooxygenase 3 n=1 Tax=Sesamum angolense TaxID=2727404 RepID=A0AAE2C1J6_9LAMI|nr:Monooxygenase 3 [Sesamum angolense]